MARSLLIKQIKKGNLMIGNTHINRLDVTHHAVHPFPNTMHFDASGRFACRYNITPSRVRILFFTSRCLTPAAEAIKCTNQ